MPIRAQDRGRGQTEQQAPKNEDDAELKLPTWIRQAFYLASGVGMFATIIYQFIIQDIKVNNNVNQQQHGEITANRQYTESVSRQIDEVKVELKSFESLHASDDKAERKEIQEQLNEIRERIAKVERDLAVFEAGLQKQKK